MACEAVGCASYDCDCLDGSTRRFRSCSATSQASACDDACLGFGGPGSPTPGTPQQSSTGLHVGQSCQGDAECDYYALMCDGWQGVTTASKCVAGSCASYDGLVQQVCTAGVVAPDANATGSRFLRRCEGIDWLHFLSDPTQPTEASVVAVVPAENQALHAVGRFRGRIKLGAEDETCLGGGLFIADYAMDGRLLKKVVTCAYQDVPVVAGDGIYLLRSGKVQIESGKLTTTPDPNLRTLVKLSFDAVPEWTRSFGVPEYKGLSLVGMNAGLYLRGNVPFKLWDDTETDAHTFVRISGDGNVAFSKPTDANVGSAYESSGYLAVTLTSPTGSIELDGQSHTVEPNKVYTAVLDDLGALKYLVLANSLNVASDGSATNARSDAGDRILERYDASGQLSWEKTVAKVSTPHLYWAGGLSSPFVLPDGRLVSMLSLSMDESTQFAGALLTGDNTGSMFVVELAPDGTPAFAQRFRPCHSFTFPGRYVAAAGSLVLAGSATQCNDGFYGDPDWPMSAAYPSAAAALILRYAPQG